KKIPLTRVAAGKIRLTAGHCQPLQATAKAATTATKFALMKSDVGTTMPEICKAHDCQPVKYSSVACRANEMAITQSTHTWAPFSCRSERIVAHNVLLSQACWYVAICQVFPQPSSIMQRRSPYGVNVGSSIVFAPSLSARSYASSAFETYT